MVVELVSVGTELLLGNIVNTNTQYLAEQCALLGLSLYHQSVVGDNHDRLAEVVKTALGRSDVVILTGGLGPTEDDLTKEVCAEVMGYKLVEDPHTRGHLEQFFKNNIYKEIPDNNWKQAMVPEGALILDNHNGMAPGLILEKDGKTAILLPGPPAELYPMFKEQVYPYLQKQQPEMIRSAVVKICGMGESQVEDKLLDLISSQTNPTIATYAKTGEVSVRVTARAKTEEEAKTLVKPVVKEIKNRLGDCVYSVKERETLEEAVVKLLHKYELTVTTAESCTGGLVAGRIVNVPGASEVLNQAIVTYANKAKMKMLGVSKKTLKKHGAVSKKTAKEMAKGAAKLAKADVAIAITGIAGPDGGTKEKPVGLVYIGCYVDGDVTVKECHFTGNREKVRDYAVVTSGDLARRCIMERFGEKRVDEK